MAQIQVTDLTFCYDGSFENIFEKVSFGIDTVWKLGLIGRNGKGKTTFSNLLLGKYEYSGTINASGVRFDYFPYPVDEEECDKAAYELIGSWKHSVEEWRIVCELNKLDTDAECLYRPYRTLSHGERMKVMLAVLFSGENEFLIIDEPTNHLDFEARQTVKKYLAGKKGFILISHDRDFLDDIIDHVLVLNRKTIEVQAGNFSSWWENKAKKDAFSEAENEKHLKEIASLKKAADQASGWAAKNENTKIGFDPIREHDRSAGTRSYIGAKTRKMQARVKAMENRIDREIQEKEGLLSDVERPASLKMNPRKYHKEVYLCAKDYSFCYPGSHAPLIQNLDFTLKQGERVFLNGKNGCGKSTLIKQILEAAGSDGTSDHLKVASGLTISYINQDTGFLRGKIREYCKKNALEESLFLALLRQLDMDRSQFEKPIEEYSEGQKKKVLLAGSIMTSAHLYIWDEPLNYIDVFSRMQIEDMILKYQPTMLVVEHDVMFREKVATKTITLA